MSLSNNFPTISPSLNLSFALTKALDPRISFVRTTTATYYDGVTIAKAEENLLLYSQEFDNTGTGAWLTSTYVGILSVTGNTNTAPDGTQTADTVVEDANNTVHRFGQNASWSGVITLSVFAKLGSGTRFLTIGLSRDGSNHGSATFNLSLGTNTQTQANGTYSSASATITAVAESFYRCTLTITTDTATSVVIGLNDTGTPTTSNRGFGATYTGDGTSSIILWGAQLEQRSAVTAYTPTTTQPITNYIPVLQTAASGVARFDHNPTTGESLGLLVEEQRTNLLTYSAEFDNAAWQKTNSSITANTIVAPDGTLTGDKLVENTANSEHYLQFVYSVTSGTTYTFSMYLKKAEKRYFVMQVGANGGGGAMTIDADTWTISAQSALIDSSITPVGNDWYRLTVTDTATGTGTTGYRIALKSNDNLTISYTGDGYSGIYIWGAQLEAAAFPTSYIATTSATVTRNADAASMTGTNFSSWYRADEGTVYSEFQRSSGVSTVGHIFGTSNGTTSERNRIFYNSSTEIRNSSINGGTQNALTAVSVTAGISIKLCATYKVNDYYLVANNGTASTDANVTLPSGQSIAFIGANTGGTGLFLNGTIKKLAYYPSRLPDAQLQALTS